MRSPNVIYIPGLGDDTNNLQQRVLRRWQKFGLVVIVKPMMWQDSASTYTKKHKDLLKTIDTLLGNGASVSLVGTSAGASEALNLYAERQDKIHKVVCICGKIQNVNLNSPDRRLKQNPTFVESLRCLNSSLDNISESRRNNILSVHPIYDGVVAVKDTFVGGAHNKTLISIGHVFTIAASLRVLRNKLVRFIKT